MSFLYMVGVPIGNPEDITFRALNILKGVSAIFCEDTRVTSKLLKNLDIGNKSLFSARSQNEERCVDKVISFLENGESVAYVSDAGTPGISDPGSKLIRGVIKKGYEVKPIPGVSAFSTLISISSYADSIVTFEGFLPQKGEKRLKRLKVLYEREEAFVLYESPYRFLKLLDELIEMDSLALILVGREMTKTFEEYKRGTVQEVYNFYKENPQQILGEFSILVARKNIRNKIF